MNIPARAPLRESPRGAPLRDDAHEAVRGIALVNIAYFALTLGDVGGKFALLSMGVAELMIWRGVFGGATILTLAAAQRTGPRWRMIVPVRWAMVFARALLSCFVSMTWFAAWQSMSLADTYAIGFTAPLLMTLLAIPLLGEKIRWRRMASTIVGFAGVLVMLRPDGDLWQPAVPLLLVGVAGMALTRIMTRTLTTTETPACQAFWITVMHLPFGFVIYHFYPSPPGIAWLGVTAAAFLGVINSAGHWVFARGYGLAPISTLAPYEYTMLLWGGVFGFLIFGSVPNWNTLAGAAIVAASGLYNLHRERVRRADAKLV